MYDTYDLGLSSLVSPPQDTLWPTHTGTNHEDTSPLIVSYKCWSKAHLPFMAQCVVILCITLTINILINVPSFSDI